MKLDVVGKSIIRVDGLSKVTGKAVYPQDIYMENMLYAKTLRSTKPHAYFKLDTSEALKIDGVVKVLTANDVPGHNSHGVLFKDHEVFCNKKARRIGDPIALVVAESEKAAEKGIDAIKVEYEELEAVFDPSEAMKDTAPQIHEGNSNIVYHYKIRKGNIEEAFKECDVIVENEYYVPMVDHVFLQPEAGVAYIEEDGMLVVAAATQYPHFDQIEIAEAMGIPTEKVKVINPAVGGAFGGREDITVQIHLAIAAKVTGRPVKMIFSREESFEAHCKRHSVKMKYKTGATKDGKLLAMEATLIGDTGAYASWAINVMRKAGVHASGPYEIPNVKVDSYAVYTNNPFAGAMRGFGATQPPIAYEQQMDIIAEKLGMDPISFRMQNIFKLNSETATGQILSESIPLERCIEEVEKKMNFIERFKGGVAQ